MRDLYIRKLWKNDYAEERYMRNFCYELHLIEKRDDHVLLRYANRLGQSSAPLLYSTLNV